MDTAEEKPKAKAEQPADVNAALHVALDRSEKALEIAKRVEARTAEPEKVAVVATAVTVTPKKEMGVFESFFTSVDDLFEDDEASA